MWKYIIILLLLSTAVLGKEVKVDQIKVYVNNDRVFGPDEDGGDIYLHQGDTLDLTVTLENEFGNKTEAKLVGTLENIKDGDDIEKTLNWFNIDAKDTKAKTLSYSIPGDANYDDYNLELRVYYRNETNQQFDYDIEFEVNVQKEVFEETPLDLHESFSNMTTMYSSMLDSMNTCFSYYNKSLEYSEQLSVCKEAKGVCNVSYEGYIDKCESDLETERKLKRDAEDLVKDCNDEKTKAENEKKQMITHTECQQRVDDAEAESKKSQNNTIGLVLGGGAIGFFLWKRRKKKEGYIEHGDYSA